MWTNGPHVELRAVEDEDLDRIVDYLQDPVMWGCRGLKGDRHGPMSRAEVRSQVEGWTAPEHGEAYAVTTGVGIVGHVRLDVGWDALTPWMHVVIAPDARRSGFGQEAAELVISHLFADTVAHAVHAAAGDWNTPGLAFARALGFSEAGRARRTRLVDGAWRDTVYFDLLRREARDAAAG